MCLGIPAKIVKIEGKMATADVGGVKRSISLQLIDEAKIGDYVILHAGFAIEKIDEKEARETLKILEEIGEIY